MDEVDEFGIPIKKASSTQQSVDEFGIPIKKKDGTKIPSPSTTPRASTGLAPKNGSLGLPTTQGSIEFKDPFKAQPKPIVKEQIPSKFKEGTMSWNLEKLKQINPEIEQKAKEFTIANKVNDQKVNEIKQKVEDEFNEVGFLNNAGNIAKQGWNTFVDVIGYGGSEQTKETWKAEKNLFKEEEKSVREKIAKEAQIAKQNNIPAPVYTQKAIDEMVKARRVKKLIDSERKSQVRSFLEDQDKNYTQDEFGKTQRERMEIYKIQDLASLAEKDRENLKQQNIVLPALIGSMNKLNDLKAKIDRKETLTPEEQELGKAEYQNYLQLSEQASILKDNFANNIDKIKSGKEALDLFKRDYSFGRHFKNLHASINDLAGGMVGLIDYELEATDYLTDKLGIVRNPLSTLFKQDITGVTQDIKEEGEKMRSETAKPISVDDINGFDDFGSFVADMFVSQAPIFGMVALGGLGIAGLGASSTGQKYEDMLEEMKPGIGKVMKNYSQEQLLGIPAVYGATETASALVDMYLLKNASRTYRSLSNPERQLFGEGVAKTIFKKTGEVVKAPVIEGFDESATKVGQNFADKFFGEDPNKSLLEGVKDAGVSGALMGGAISIAPMVVAQATKPFGIGNAIQKQAKELMDFQSQLDKNDLSAESRKIIEEQLAKSKQNLEGLIKKQVKNMSSLSNAQFQEINRLEKAQANIKSKANEIKTDEALDINVKKQLLTNLETEFKANEQRRVDLLQRGASVQLERLEPTESKRLKDLAEKRLMKELNPDGTKSIKLEDEEISKTAIQIYNEEVKENNLRSARDKELADREKAKQKVNEQTPTPEAQPQAEVQKPSEAEKVDEVDDIEKMFPRNRASSSEFRSHQGERFEISLKPVDMNDTGKGYEVSVSTSLKDGRYVFSDALSGEFATKKEAEDYAMEFVKKDKKTEALKAKETPKPQEVSPVEDVVAPSVEKPLSFGENNDVKEFDEVYYHEGYGSKTNGNAVYLGTKEVAGEDAKPYKITAKKPYIVETSDDFDIIQGFVDEYKSSNPESKWHPNTTDYVNTKLKELGYDSLIIKETSLNDDKGYKNIVGSYGDPQVVVFDKTQIKEVKDEATPSNNITPDGNVRPTNDNVGEVRATEQEIPAKESVQKPVDGGEVKGDAKIEKNSTFIPKKETIKDDKGNPITFYHGSNNEFTDFDETMLGSFTGADSAKEGFFFTDNFGVANSYRQQAIYDAPNIEGLKEVLNGLSKEEIAKLGQEIIGNDAKYYYGDMSKQESIDDIVDDVIRDVEYESYYPDRNKYIEKISKYLKEKDIDLKPYLDKGQVVETNLDIKNPKIVDANEQIAEEIGLTKIIKEAKEQGHDGVIIKNVYDSVSFEEKGNDTQLSNIVVVFNKNQINIKNKPSETFQPKPIEGKAEVKKYKLSEKGQAFNVKNKNGKLEVTNSKGEKVSKPTERAVLRKHADTIDFSSGEKAIDNPDFEAQDWENEIIKKSNNASEVAEAINYVEIEDLSELTPKEKLSYKEQAIREGYVPIKEDGYNQFGDRNNKPSKTFFDEKGREIDDLADELSLGGIEITPQDIADFITNNREGVRKTKAKENEQLSQEQIKKNNLIDDLKNKFTELTGLPASKEYILKAIEQSNRKSELNSVLDQMTDAELIELDKTINQIEEETYGKVKQVAKGIDKGKGDKISEQEPRVQKELTRKEKRINAVDAKIEDLANALKDLLPSAPDTDGLNKQGLSQDDLIDFISKNAKILASATITIDEAIRQVIEHLKSKGFDFDVNIEDVKKIFEAKEASDAFERKTGKKSLLTRAATGSDAIIKKAISKYSLDYEVESQEVAKNNADAFVEDVGIQTALEAVRSGQITGAEKAFVYAKIIDEITNNIANYSEEEIVTLEKLNVEILGEIAKEFDQESRNAGRFIAALGAIYNGSMGRYNLSKQVADYKALNNGVIPDEILKKFKEADIRIKELEAKLQELQKEKEVQESEQEFKNIVESIARKNKLPSNRGISDTKKAKVLADKLRSFKTTSLGGVTAATPISLAYDGAIEVTAVIIENGGKLSDAIKKGLDFIRGKKLNPAEEQQAVNNFLGAFDNLEPAGKNINIDDFGKLKIPASLIREHVENGIDNIDDLVVAISQDVKEMLPDEEFTDREIRDAITQYGKTSNPTKDDIEQQIGIMKSLGRLISGLEDAYEGKRPLRSGLQRRAMTLEERQMQRKLKELLRDLPMDDADLSRSWKTALDAIKSRLTNQIADLDKQIADGEKRKAEKKTIEYDEEAKALKSIRDQKRDLLDEMVGKPELTEEERIEKAIILTQKSIEALQEMIVTGEIDYKKKPTPVTSAKLDALREQRRQLAKQIEEMRKESGVAEMKRLETAKKSRLNRIKELEKKIKEKDFSVRTQKPLPVDAELLEIEMQLQEQKAIYEKEKHIFELNNRSPFRKLATGIVNAIGITRLLKAGGEFSQVLVQQGFLTPEILVRNPKAFFTAMARLGKAFISPDSAKRYEAEMKSNPLYPLMQKTKLTLTGTDHKLDAQEENYQLDLITDSWNKIGEKLGDKKVRTITGLIKSALGITLKEGDVKSIGQQFKEASPWKMFERGAVTYSNYIKMVKFAQGVKELQKQGKDPINDIEDYKKVAKYVNTFSGRANLGKAEMISKDAALLVFSLRNWVSQIQQLNPFFYSNLGDSKQWKNVKSISDLKNIKPTVAQKMAVKSFMTSATAIIAFKVAFMSWANAMTDDDEEKWVLETDSRSSDFGKLRKGNKTFDLWHGLNGLVVLYSRILTQETKSTKTGEIKELGKGFGTPTTKELLIRYASNKLAPSAGYAWRLADTTGEIDPNTGEKYRVDPFGNVYGEKEMKDLFVPIYWSAVNEIRKEDPDVYEGFLTSIGILGMSVGTDPKGEKFKDIIGDQGKPQRPSLPKMPSRPSR